MRTKPNFDISQVLLVGAMCTSQKTSIISPTNCDSKRLSLLRHSEKCCGHFEWHMENKAHISLQKSPYNIKGHCAVSNPEAWTFVIQVISEIKNIVSTVGIPIVRNCFTSNLRNSTILKNKTLFYKRYFQDMRVKYYLTRYLFSIWMQL